MIRFFFIISLLILAAVSSSKGAQNASSLLKPDAEALVLQQDDSGTQSREASPFQDLNEDENELMLQLPFLHFTNSLAISYSPCYCTASEAVEIIPRPPKA